jgi:class 3 adenylate cyclase
LIVLFRSFRHQQHSNELLSREKQRSDTLLHNILPEEVAEELKETGGAHAKQFDHVSVLFTDFVNFTGTAETLSPQVLVRELHECFSAFDGIIEKNGLEKIKTVGDAYVAACGLPVENAEHAQKCVKAALEILEFMEARRRHERAFEIRIGINSGPVVAGIVGVKKFAYDIWGDTVNTAARLEQSGAPGRINISQSTYELVRDKYACEYRGKIAAKNKGEVEMYFIGAPVKKNGVASLDTTPMTLQ